MSALDDLSPDRKAVLQLILAKGKGYEEIAELLGIAAETVRARAHAAVEALGPESAERPGEGQRARIADYLLGQQTSEARDATRDQLAGSASARAWARAVADALAPLARDPLPEIPAAATTGADAAELEQISEQRTGAAEPSAPPAASPAKSSSSLAARASSNKLGGALIIGGVAILIAVLVIVLVSGGGDDGGKASSTTSSTPTTTSAAQQPQVLAQINLRGPGKAVGLSQVLMQGNQRAIAIAGQRLQPTTDDTAYAVWLYNSPSDAKRLGYAPPVEKNGRLTGVAPLPADAARYRELIVSRESSKKPADEPTTIVLRGNFRSS